LRPPHAEIALILNPELTTKQFLQAICQEFHVEFQVRDTGRQLIDHLNRRLLELHAAGKRAVLIVDEAQTMSPELLEQVRLLTNLETSRQKLLQIILIGQPELREMLSRPEMRQVAQRITGRYHLEPLSAADTAVYVSHRMRVAGGRPGIFDKRALRALFRLSQGIPRLINVIADRSLLAAYTLESPEIGAGLVRRAANEVFGERRKSRWWPWAASAAGLVLVAAAAMTFIREPEPGAAPATLPPEPAVAASPVVERGNVAQPLVDRPLPTLLEIVAASDIESATGRLFGLWNAEYAASSGPVCTQAESQGLRCLALENGSRDELRALGLPALVELRMPALLDFGSQRVVRGTVLLPGHDPGTATILEAHGKRHFESSELDRLATGKALLLFRPAVTDAAGTLAEGARGVGVAWIRTVLSELGRNAIESSDPLLFDATLAASLREFQAQRGLVADGVVTDRTLLHLQSAIGMTGFDADARGR
jgi:general secretion pathway protein A